MTVILLMHPGVPYHRRGAWVKCSAFTIFLRQNIKKINDMRVLMFGWEFPPHISGGLGTASYGLTKGMATLDDLEVIFVVPKTWGDEDQTMVRLVGANQVPVAYKQVFYKGFRRPVERIEVSSKIVPVSYTHLRAHETVLDLVCR